MKKKLYIIISTLLLLISCATKDINVDLTNINNELEEKLSSGIKLYNKGKFTRAKDDFDYIILNDRGSDIGLEARYYQAEALFQLEQYEESISSFENFLEYSNNSLKIELSRFKICQAHYNISNKFNRDQSNNDYASIKLQLFIDDYPNSTYLEEAENLIETLRARKAQKIYETGRLYLKLKEYDSSILYFNITIDDFYDTKYADKSRISIIFLYLLSDRKDLAEKFLLDNNQNFLDINKLKEAEELIDGFEDRRNWFSKFVRLYK